MTSVNHVLRSGRVASLATLALAASLAASVLSGPTASAATAPVPREFFGTHHANLGLNPVVGWPNDGGTVGSVRLWDNNVSWRDIESSPGVYDFTRLDGIMARAKGKADVVLVLGQTPAFHVAPGAVAPTSIEYYGVGATRMPTQTAWQAYVKAVIDHNAAVWRPRGVKVRYQVWNEANVAGYWSGTPQQMAELTKWTRDQMFASGDRTPLLAPAMVTRLGTQRSWLARFYGSRTSDGQPVGAKIDIVSLQLYPEATGGPERSIALLKSVRGTLKGLRVTKPIWNTEVNYGLVGGINAGSAAKALPGATQAAYVARTFALNAGNGVGRVYWYSWDLKPKNGHQIASTLLTGGNGVTPTTAGRAFRTSFKWIYNTRPAGCTNDRTGLYTCTFRDRTGRAVNRIIWKVRGTAKTKAARAATARVKAPKFTSVTYRLPDGAKRRTKAGATVTVGLSPIRFRSSR